MSLSQARLKYRLTVILSALSQGLVSLRTCMVRMTLVMEPLWEQVKLSLSMVWV